MNEKEKAIKRLKENPLDRERWIEAGKAMGWNRLSNIAIESYDLIDGIKENLSWEVRDDRYEWFYQWHRFINHLASGKSAESFFAELKV